MERRRESRRAPAADEPIIRLRLRAGRELTVIDVSNAGALVEGASRFLPGTHVDAHLVTKDGRVLVRSRVIRAYVWSLGASSVVYRAALAFEQVVDTAPPPVPAESFSDEPSAA
jgi:hypothetical protein